MAKCNYFNRNFGDTSRVDLVQNTVYCACADVTKKNDQDIARKACPFQMGDFEQPWFSRVTYWECEIGPDLLKNRDEDSDGRGIFAAARSYRKSIVRFVSL